MSKIPNSSRDQLDDIAPLAKGVRGRSWSGLFILSLGDSRTSEGMTQAAGCSCLWSSVRRDLTEDAALGLLAYMVTKATRMNGT